MKYKDPITGELRDVIIKSGDTLPIGTIVDFDGDVIPDGYEEATEASDVVNSLEGNEIYRAPSVKAVNEVLNGEKSMGSIVVDDVSCKNLFDKNDAITGYRLGSDGALFADSNYFCSGFITVKPNIQYTANWAMETRECVCYYDESYNFIERNESIKTFTTPSNCHHVRITGLTSDINNRQLEKGPVATDYVEHKEFSNKQIYSTSEQRIGTWIDGKPLYRKVINIGLMPNATSSTIAHNISSVDMIRTNGSFGIANGYSVPIPNASAGSTTNGQIAINIDRTNIYLTTNSNRSDLTGYIILEYTKTTD